MRTVLKYLDHQRGSRVSLIDDDQQRLLDVAQQLQIVRSRSRLHKTGDPASVHEGAAEFGSEARLSLAAWAGEQQHRDASLFATPPTQKCLLWSGDEVDDFEIRPQNQCRASLVFVQIGWEASIRKFQRVGVVDGDGGVRTQGRDEVSVIEERFHELNAQSPMFEMGTVRKSDADNGSMDAYGGTGHAFPRTVRAVPARRRSSRDIEVKDRLSCGRRRHDGSPKEFRVLDGGRGASAVVELGKAQGDAWGGRAADKSAECCKPSMFLIVPIGESKQGTVEGRHTAPGDCRIDECRVTERAYLISRRPWTFRWEQNVTGCQHKAGCDDVSRAPRNGMVVSVANDELDHVAIHEWLRHDCCLFDLTAVVVDDKQIAPLGSCWMQGEFQRVSLGCGS